MIEEKYKDIFYVGEYEIVPVWKQCGEYDPNWSDDEKSLWNSGQYDYHMEYIPIGDPGFEKYYLESYWYVWKKHRCGCLSLRPNGKYQAHMKDVMIGWDSPYYNTMEEVIQYITNCNKAYLKSLKNKRD